MAAEEGQVIACHSEEQWKEEFQKAKDSKKLVFFFNFHFYVVLFLLKISFF